MTLYIGDKPVGLMKIVKDTKYIDKTKYGISVDNLLGDVDENGVLQQPATANVINLAGVKSLSSSQFRYWACDDRIKVEKFEAPDLEESLYQYEFDRAFSGNKTIKNATFGYTYVGGYVFQYAFSNTSEDFVPVFPRLKQIARGYSFYYAFQGRDCPDFAKVFPVLEEISGNYAFANCGYLITSKVIHFPSLIKITGATGSYSATFYGLSSPIFKLPKCTTLENNYIFPSSTTEIHFAAENQASIEASAGYASKWGAGSSCTIFFDL